MNWINVLTAVFEAKKQHIIITIIVVIISSIGGFYAMSNKDNSIDNSPDANKEITINITTTPEEKPQTSNSAELRKGEFKKSKKVTW